MSTRNLTLLIVLVVILLFGGCACTRYNGLVTSDQGVKTVIAARSKATSVTVDVNDSNSLAAYQRAQGQLQGSFSRLMAVAEAYPDLKTTQQFQNFQTDISGTENRINVARRDFNSAVQDYNLKVKTFPNNIFAGIFGFHEKPYYKSDAGSENAPDIHFDIK